MNHIRLLSFNHFKQRSYCRLQLPVVANLLQPSLAKVLVRVLILQLLTLPVIGSVHLQVYSFLHEVAHTKVRSNKTTRECFIQDILQNGSIISNCSFLEFELQHNFYWLRSLILQLRYGLILCCCNQYIRIYKIWYMKPKIAQQNMPKKMRLIHGSSDVVLFTK